MFLLISWFCFHLAFSVLFILGNTWLSSLTQYFPSHPIATLYLVFSSLFWLSLVNPIPRFTITHQSVVPVVVTCASLLFFCFLVTLITPIGVLVCLLPPPIFFISHRSFIYVRSSRTGHTARSVFLREDL